MIQEQPQPQSRQQRRHAERQQAKSKVLADLVQQNIMNKTLYLILMENNGKLAIPLEDIKNCPQTCSIGSTYDRENGVVILTALLEKPKTIIQPIRKIIGGQSHGT